ncbi:hypothetical protein [Janthinobacterium lividum]|uniref:hypothetical protein n=1 Tax=Janthinobacterium lividum TaxID=29581 RepID=UPI000FE2285C|nr:hypothetical protein [Janthinobacterium lividum]
MANFIIEHTVHSARKTLVRKRVRPMTDRLAKDSKVAHELQDELCARVNAPYDTSNMTRFTGAMSLDEIMAKIMGTSLNPAKIATR